MRLRRSANIAVIGLMMSAAALANPHRLDTLSYNFQLTGGGGGSAAQLDQSLNVEIFCNDFANEIFVPHNMYSANLTTITSTSDLSMTRFGHNTSWRTVTISDDGADSGGNDSADSAIINAANSLGRYQMAAYLVAQYNRGGGSSAYNNGIQTAIWEILDPASYAVAPVTADPSAALEQAAEWLNGTTTAARDSYLANYRIVSDSTMTACNGAGTPLCGGFQEQITTVPEPRHVSLMLIGFLSLCSIGFRKRYRITGSAL